MLASGASLRGVTGWSYLLHFRDVRLLCCQWPKVSLVQLSSQLPCVHASILVLVRVLSCGCGRAVKARSFPAGVPH